MSLLIKALKQAERRHQEALQQATAEAAAVEAALPAAAEPNKPNGIAPSVGPDTDSATQAFPTETLGEVAALEVLVPGTEVAVQADAAPAAWSAPGLSLEPRPEAGEAAAHAPPGAGLAPEPGGAAPAAPAPSVERSGILGLLPARMEAPPLVAATTASAPAAVAATAAADAPTPAAVPPVTAGAEAQPTVKAAHGRPGPRRLVLLGLAAACGVGAWLALEWLSMPVRPVAPMLQGGGSAPMLPPLGETALPPLGGTEASASVAPPGAGPSPSLSASPVPMVETATTATTAASPAAASPAAASPTAASPTAAGSAAASPAAAAPPPSATTRAAPKSATPTSTPGPAVADRRAASPVPAAARSAVSRPAPAVPLARVAASGTPVAEARRPATAPPVVRRGGAGIAGPAPAPTPTVAAVPASSTPSGGSPPTAPVPPAAATPPNSAEPRFVRSPMAADQVARLLESAWAAALRSSATARPLYEQVLQLDRNNVDALTGLASMAARDGDHAGAERLWRRVLEVDPNDAAARAGLVTLLGPADSGSQESHLRGLLARDASDPGLHYALGNVLAAQSRWAEAQQSFFAAVAGDPEQPDYLFNLAVSLERIRQPQAALPLYRKALDAAGRRAARFDAGAVRARIAAIESARAPAPAAPTGDPRPAPAGPPAGVAPPSEPAPTGAVAVPTGIVAAPTGPASAPTGFVVPVASEAPTEAVAATAATAPTEVAAVVPPSTGFPFATSYYVGAQ